MTQTHIQVGADDARWYPTARQWAQQLDLSCCFDSDQTATDWLLQCSSQGLSLHHLPTATAIQVDFVHGTQAHRRRFGGGRGQPLARAAGLKSGHSPKIVDATAGLGRDAFVLAHLGCEVQLLERSSIIAALLEDGLSRAQADADIGEWVQARLHLQAVDAGVWLQGLAAEAYPDVIYLDPMYPERKKSALVKKEMRLLQQLLDQDEDSAALLELALQRAQRRVVVKRPKLAPSLNQRSPDTSISSKNTRFDIYFTHL